MKNINLEHEYWLLSDLVYRRYIWIVDTNRISVMLLDNLVPLMSFAYSPECQFGEAEGALLETTGEESPLNGFLTSLKTRHEEFHRIVARDWQQRDKMDRYLILGEAGGLGSDGRYFVITCFETKDYNELYHALADKTGEEEAIATITAQNLNMAYIVVDKAHVDEALTKNKNALHDYLLWRLLDKVIEQRYRNRKTHIICDRQSDLGGSQSRTDTSIDFRTPSETDADIMQAVAYVAKAINSYYEDGDTRFLTYIRRKLDFVEVFPCQQVEYQDENDTFDGAWYKSHQHLEKKELHVFVEDSCKYSVSARRSPFSLFTLLFHDPSCDIEDDIARLDESLSQKGYGACAVHAGELIRGTDEYKHYPKGARKEIFDTFFAFLRTTPIKYHTMTIDMAVVDEKSHLKEQINKQLFAFFKNNKEAFSPYGHIVFRSDRGGCAFGHTIASTIEESLGKVKRKNVAPAHSRLFQIAEMLHYLELHALKIEQGAITKRERDFFGAEESFEAYLSAAREKRI
jgi:hypothetical protein